MGRSRSCRREGRSIRNVAETVEVWQQTLRGWVKLVALDAGVDDDGLTSAEREESSGCATRAAARAGAEIKQADGCFANRE